MGVDWGVGWTRIEIRRARDRSGSGPHCWIPATDQLLRFVLIRITPPWYMPPYRMVASVALT